MTIVIPPNGSPKLAGVRAKLLRAQDHFDDIHSRIEACLGPKSDGGSVPLTCEVNGERQSVTFRLAEAKPLDPDLPLIVGDCIHNLRSALDHLVLQLALLKGTPIAEAADKTSFPVCLNPKDFRSKTKNFAKLIRREALTALKESQPYKTSNPPESAFLWLLSELDIIDKHRLLFVVSKKVKLTKIAGTAGPQRILVDPVSDWKPHEDGAELFTAEFSSGVPTEMHMEVQTAMTVQFADTGLVCDGGIVEEILNGCGGFVEKTIDDFGKRFFGE